MDELQQLRERNAELEAENAALRRRLAQVEHELEKILQRRKRTGADRTKPRSSRTDRRRKKHRNPPGPVRAEPPPDTVLIEHEVYPQQCTQCGGRDLEVTDQYEDHV